MALVVTSVWDSARPTAKRSRSETTAATHNVTTVATAMKSWIERMVCVIEWKWNGPSAFLVLQIATPVTSHRASVAPRWPKRRAAQTRPGNARYSSAFGLEKASAVNPPVDASINAPSTASRRDRFLPGCDQAGTKGTTARAPQAAPGHPAPPTGVCAAGGGPPPGAGE